MPEEHDPPDARGELLARLGDIALVERLRADGCAGPDWLVVRAWLAEYCISSLHGIVLEGAVNKRTAKLGRPAGLRADEMVVLRAERAERETVVHDAVVGGLGVFRRVGILDGGWRSTGKASLRTYAANACLMHVGDAVRRWRRQQQSDADPCGVGCDLDPWPAAHGEDPGDEVVERLDAQERVRAVLAAVGEPTRSAIVLRLASDSTRSWKDIAAELDVSEKRIEAGLRKLRQARPREGGEPR